MEILRRNTDYALRAMVNLARHWQQGPVSTKTIACSEDISCQLLRKLMRQLLKDKLVRSSSGPSGGFELKKSPARTSLLEIIIAIQGPVNLNKCLLPGYSCSRRKTCPVHKKLNELQKHIGNYFSDITLQDLLQEI
ncbi:MAG: Rrf2 family transcriptional regulator [Sedimentisphaerales bacterium]|nr:Rrf2 family transcriptional regulator [Sedimentisphaerales bacterium]